MEGIEGLVELPLSAIRPNQLQPRAHFDEAALEGLAASVAELGVLQPVLVREVADGGGYELIAGERRFRAARMAGLVTVPAVVRRVDDRTSLEHAVVENLHRADLSGVEEAVAYRQLMDDFGLTQEEVARRVGRSRSAVANTLRLLQLPPVVQRLIMNRELSAGHARAVLAVGDGEEQIRLAGRVVAEGLSVRETEQLARVGVDGGRDRAGRGSGGDSDGGGDGVAGEARSAAVLEIEEILADWLDTRVTVSTSGSRGRLLVEFADADDLDRIFRRLDRGREADDFAD